MLKNLDQISPLSESIISFLSTISKQEGVEKIVVFGSRAFNDFEKYSDLDLAVDAPTMTKYEWQKLKEFAIYELNSFIKVSLVHYSTNPEKLKERINQTGKIIYER
ncbi:nucleotidyltransferase family protein [Flavobacterium plurextorum]|uniref:nucleotidyltransferase family protein n=1 Tax=Flavobacterium plurextorum TaxID=1114867 RepID=UPI003756A052